jgi:hypothetical protein
MMSHVAARNSHNECAGLELCTAAVETIEVAEIETAYVLGIHGIAECAK